MNRGVIERPTLQTEEIPFRESPAPDLDQRIARLASAANSIAGTVNKLLIIAIAFCALWGLEVLFRIQRIIERW